MIEDPVFAVCARSFPERPVIDVAETPWRRDELDARIDYWMKQLAAVMEYPCPHGCKTHTVPSLDPTACGHYHSPDEWGHREQIHNSAYWAAIGKAQP